MGKIKEKMFEIAELIQQMLDSGVKDSEIDKYLKRQLTPGDYEFYVLNKDVIFQHFVRGMNESYLNEGSDWVYLRSGKVFIDSWDGFFILTDESGAPDLSQEVSQDDPEYDEIYTSLSPSDKEAVDAIRGESSQDNYNQMDESIMMPRINEGCGCGKKRTATVPTPATQRPQPTVVRRPLPLKKKLDERFAEKSDPVKDMGIGVNPKVEAEKFMEEMYGNINRIAEKYFNNRKMEGPAYLIHKFFRLVLNGKAPQTAFFLAAEDENFYGDGAWVVEIRKKAADSIYKHHYIKINPNDPRLSGF